ncbi:MAG: UDP-N-acetylmuramate dehydrogenase [Butyrivibrio sp.]|nr:UDP-N-acetylmuramate dehydrogenase [Butyrivibrio sp.]
MNSEITERLKAIVGDGAVVADEPMSRHTTFKTGGPASLFIRPKTKEQLLSAATALRDSRTEHFFLGNGSNILVSDRGYQGVAVSTEGLSDLFVVNETGIRAGAGVLNSQVANLATRSALTGFEFAAGIPGTVGGAMIMNAGAYGGEMKMITESVEALTPGGEVITLSCDECSFRYRTSALKENGYLVLSALFRLEKGESEEITARIKELSEKRREKQPLDYPSAGSTFKRPEGYFAGKLIEEAGLKGFSIGGAAVSEKHCGFVINKGSATSAEIYGLIQTVREKVYSSRGVELEPEVIMIGEF